MLFTNIFDSKIIDDKAECDCMGNVFPWSEGVGYFIVSLWGDLLLEVLVREATCLRQAVNATSDFQINETICLFIIQVVLVNDVLGEHLEGHSHVFASIHWGT